MDIASDLKDSDVLSSCGVTTGEVFCGLVGGETRCEYALIGDVVNLAARLMAATSNEIRVDFETYQRSCKAVPFEDLGSISVKGKKEKIKIFKPVAGTVSAAITLRKIPIIGRKEEVNMVKARVDKFSSLSLTSAIVFEGESGMGKSRMLIEAVEYIDGHKLPVLPNNGNYEVMPGDLTMSFMTAVFKEMWNISDSMTADAKTTIVKAEILRLASPFVVKHMSLMEYVIPNLCFGEELASSVPASSTFVVLVRMVAGLLVFNLKARKKVLVCDNAHGLDIQTWNALCVSSTTKMDAKRSKM